MGMYPRVRTAAKWGGLGLAVAFAAAWAVSWSWQGSVSPRPRTSVSLGVGAIMVNWSDTLTPERHAAKTGIIRTGRSRAFIPYRETDATGGVVVLPLWIPTFASASVAAWAWQLGRRARRLALAGRCPKCGYDRSTLPPAAPCPECGAGGGRTA